jgi:hypothetical protein
MKTRKCKVYELHRPKGKMGYEKVCVGEGIFHMFGIDYEEFEAGPGNYTTAVVEMPDGSIQNLPLEFVVFVKEEDEE